MLIDSREALRNLVERFPLIGLGQPGPVVLQLEHLAREENEAIQKRLNRLYSACGCEAGAALSITSLTLYSLYAYFNGETLGLASSGAILLGFLFFVAGGAAGKMIGLFLARRELLRTLRDLLDRIPTTGEAEFVVTYNNGVVATRDQWRPTISSALLSGSQETWRQYRAGGRGTGHAENDLRDAEAPGGLPPDGPGEHRSAPEGHGRLVAGLSQPQRLDCAAGVPCDPVPSSTHR